MTDKTVTIELTEAEAIVSERLLNQGGTGIPNAAIDARLKIRAALDALTPPMPEPTYPGAVVMTDEGLAVWAALPNDKVSWVLRHCDDCNDWDWYSWSDLRNPRPLTPAEYRQHGIPQELPDGHVAVPLEGLPNDTWMRIRAESYRNCNDAATAFVLDTCATALEKHQAGRS